MAHRLFAKLLQVFRTQRDLKGLQDTALTAGMREFDLESHALPQSKNPASELIGTVQQKRLFSLARLPSDKVKKSIEVSFFHIHQIELMTSFHRGWALRETLRSR